jgi:hypothetical protein
MVATIPAVNDSATSTLHLALRDRVGRSVHPENEQVKSVPFVLGGLSPTLTCGDFACRKHQPHLPVLGASNARRSDLPCSPKRAWH